LAVFWSAAEASAFCLTRGCNDKKEACEYDEHGCLTEGSGHLLHWGSSCVSFDVQRDGSALREIGYDAAHEVIRAAFSEWLSADCGGGLGPELRVNDFGPVECRSAEYNQDSPNANVFMFRDDGWPYENAIDTLALTTLIFNADTGEIYDADVEVNTFESDMSIDAGFGDIHFPSVITHEIGHFLGLSHSDVAGSTMRPSYAPGATGMASIEEDDVTGICTALAPGRETKTDSCEPRHGFSGECAVPESGCQLSPASPTGVGSVLLALLGLSSMLTRRRLRP
jgi:hypothetical protein